MSAIYQKILLSPDPFPEFQNGLLRNLVFHELNDFKGHLGSLWLFSGMAIFLFLDRFQNGSILIIFVKIHRKF